MVGDAVYQRFFASPLAPTFHKNSFACGWFRNDRARSNFFPDEWDEAPRVHPVQPAFFASFRARGHSTPSLSKSLFETVITLRNALPNRSNSLLPGMSVLAMACSSTLPLLLSSYTRGRTGLA